jgi:ABC-2 type transport system ATP-binding protein
MDVAIAAEALTRRFEESTAVDQLHLHIRQGEIYGFLGPNGAGKSTTVRMLCTLLGPTSGWATVGGFDVAAQPDQVRTRIGVALQDVALDPKQTGTELLRLQARLYGLTRRDTDRRLTELAQLVELGDALDRRIATYSGGMKRRLDLAAALVHNPDVLFLDEPTTGLDPVSRVRVWDEVRRLNTQLGMTIFLTTQYLEEADELADRVGIIDGGRLVAEGTPVELKRTVGQDVIIARIDSDTGAAVEALRTLPEVQQVDARHDEVVVSVADGATAIGAVAIALGHAHVQIRDLTLRTPTLDDVFLDLTGARIQNHDADGHDTPSDAASSGAASTDTATSDTGPAELDALETV